MKEKRISREFPKVQPRQTVRLCRECYQRVGEYHLFSCKWYQEWKKEREEKDNGKRK